VLSALVKIVEIFEFLCPGLGISNRISFVRRASLLESLAEGDPIARERAFRQWLYLPLREQWADLERYVCDGSGDPAARLSSKHYRKLPPRSAKDFEKRLFMCNIEAMLAAMRNERACPPERSLSHVFQHVGWDLGSSLKVIGAAIGVSARELGLRFRERTGLPFRQYLCFERIRHAVDALRDRECQVQEAALQAGYTDPSNLIRDFRKVLGTTPGHFRQEFLVVNVQLQESE
jgi:AraC-like DNA-binding protein